MSNYTVGQTLYLVSNKRMSVSSVIVTEEVTRKTLEGASTTYLVRNDKASSTHQLESLPGNVFVTIDQVRSSLIENATKAIDKICKTAEDKAAQLGGISVPDFKIQEQSSRLSPVVIPSDEKIKSIILEDGTPARINLENI